MNAVAPISDIVDLDDLAVEHGERTLILAGIDSVRPCLVVEDEDARVVYGEAPELSAAIRAKLRGEGGPVLYDLTVLYPTHLVADRLQHDPGAAPTLPGPVESLRVIGPDIGPALAEMGARLAEYAERLPDVPPEDVALHGRLVTELRLSELTGYSTSRLETMRRRLAVRQGTHWFKTPANGIVWDVLAFDDWQRGEG